MTNHEMKGYKLYTQGHPHIPMLLTYLQTLSFSLSLSLLQLCVIESPKQKVRHGSKQMFFVFVMFEDLLHNFQITLMVGYKRSSKGCSID